MIGKIKCVVVLFASLCFLVPAAQCLALPNDAEPLQTRAKSFWEARVKKDYSALYQFLQPHQKESQTEEQYVQYMQKNDAFTTLSFSQTGAEVSGEMGWVKTTYDIEYTKYPGVSRQNKTDWKNWLKIDGVWYPSTPEQAKHLPFLPPSVRLAEEEAKLMELSNRFWTAMEKQDRDTLYEIFEPAFRTMVTKDQFNEKKAQLVYVSHEVLWAQVNREHPEEGNVLVKYSTRIDDPNLTKLAPSEQLSNEAWVKINGQWFRPAPAFDE